MNALFNLIKHHEEMHHDPNVSIIHGFGDSEARAELEQLREKAAKWDKLQADIAAGVIVLEMPPGDE